MSAQTHCTNVLYLQLREVKETKALCELKRATYQEGNRVTQLKEEPACLGLNYIGCVTL